LQRFLETTAQLLRSISGVSEVDSSATEERLSPTNTHACSHSDIRTHTCHMQTRTTHATPHARACASHTCAKWLTDALPKNLAAISPRITARMLTWVETPTPLQLPGSHSNLT